MPSNSQTITLQGVTLSDLSAANFTILDSSAATEVLALLGGGDPGTGDPGRGDPGTGDPGTGDPGTGDPATVVITWSWSQDAVITGFDPASDTVFIDWIGADQLEVTEVNGSAVFAVPSNNQTTTLQGIALADLSPDNFTILNATAQAEVFALIGDGDGSGTGDPDTGDPGTGDPGAGDPGTGDSGTGDGASPDHVAVTWNWGVEEVIGNFDPANDVLEFGSVSTAQIGITEVGDDLIIEVLNNGGHRYVLEHVQAEDLYQPALSETHCRLASATARQSHCEESLRGD